MAYRHRTETKILDSAQVAVEEATLPGFPKNSPRAWPQEVVLGQAGRIGSVTPQALPDPSCLLNPCEVHCRSRQITNSLTALMAKNLQTVPITDLRQDAASILNRMKKSDRPLVITQRGRAAAVMLSPAAYRRSEHERELLRLLARGEREITKGRGYDLDRVLADADKVLARKS